MDTLEPPYRKAKWEEAVGEIRDIDMDADAELLAWAKSVKRGIRTLPY